MFSIGALTRARSANIARPGCGRPITARNRRFAKAEFIKRYLPTGFFDLAILDEVHELKGGGTAQGQAMSCLIARSKKVLALTGTLMGGYSKDLFYLLWRMFPRQMVQIRFRTTDAHWDLPNGTVLCSGPMRLMIFDPDWNQASIGRKSRRARIKEAPGISPLLLPDLLLERVSLCPADRCHRGPAGIRRDHRLDPDESTNFTKIPTIIHT